MKDIEAEKKIAVLIDAENTQRALLEAVLAEISKHGHIVVKRAYGDWSSNHLKNWKTPLNELAIQPVQQFAYTQGKNSSDAALIIDAMDLLYSERFDAFVLVTSDSDFTSLASRLRASQIVVFGVGENKTPVAFRNACDNFIFTDVLREQDEELEWDADNPQEPSPAAKKTTPSKKKTRNELRGDTKLVSTLRNAVEEYSDEDGWAPLSAAGNLVKRQFPDFDPRRYGYSTLLKLMEATELFEVERKLNGNGHAGAVFVRDKRG